MRMTHLITACLTLVIGTKATAWGPEGHEIVATIAQQRLGATAKSRIAAIINTTPETLDLASIANWADKVRPVRPETAPWHFVDIPLKRTTFDPATDCADDNCVIAQIKLDVDALTNQTGNQLDALRFLVHFLGDIHQPLHCADNNDRGGNNVHIKFHDTSLNLHKLWDSGLLDQLEDQDQLIADLIRTTTSSQESDWSSGTPTDWALESHALAIKPAYSLVPKVHGGSLPVISEDYENTADPIVQTQLQKAGVRLAMVLNQIFDAH